MIWSAVGAAELSPARKGWENDGAKRQTYAQLHPQQVFVPYESPELRQRFYVFRATRVSTHVLNLDA